MTKIFPLRVILTVTTDRLLTERKGPDNNGIGDYYEILNWVTGDSLMTHQLHRANESGKPWLLKCFPELGKVNETLNLLDQRLSAKEPQEAIAHWLTQIKMIVPELRDFYEVEPIPEGWVTIDPMIELESMVGKGKIITVAA